MHDVIVIGGGPAGSTTAARLAQLGRRVLVVERERFPRFHIGESLLPCSTPILAELGVLPAIEQAGFVPKHGAEFVTGDGTLEQRYPFANGLVPGPGATYEVERDRFDELLLENAVKQGAEVEQGTEVRAFESHADGVDVRVRDAQGRERDLGARVLVDASGQRSMIATRFGLRQMDPALRNFALYSHYEGASRHAGEREGDISIVLAAEGWWWVIPLAADRVSVGWVAPSRALRGRAANESLFLERLEGTPYLRRRFQSARRVAPVRGASDYSYRSRRFAGERWLLVGDAAAFIDPVFSSGVYLGMLSGFRAAHAIHDALARGAAGRRPFSTYERWFSRLIDTYSSFVRGFYDPAFAEVMMSPSDSLSLRRAVTSLLAGHGVGHFDVTWRIWLFFVVARLNRRLRLVPRLPGRREAARR